MPTQKIITSNYKVFIIRETELPVTTPCIIPKFLNHSENNKYTAECVTAFTETKVNDLLQSATLC